MTEPTKVHLDAGQPVSHRGRQKTACNRWLIRGHFTTDLNAVTCKHCRTSVTFWATWVKGKLDEPNG